MNTTEIIEVTATKIKNCDHNPVFIFSTPKVHENGTMTITTGCVGCGHIVETVTVQIPQTPKGPCRF